MLVLHIIIAIISLVWATITYIKPSINKLRMSYAFIYGVIITGVLLVVLNHAVIVQACTSGLAYLVISVTATVFTRKKLAIQLATEA